VETRRTTDVKDYLLKFIFEKQFDKLLLTFWGLVLVAVVMRTREVWAQTILASVIGAMLLLITGRVGHRAADDVQSERREVTPEK
jgi:uncharacterized membrane protein